MPQQLLQLLPAVYVALSAAASSFCLFLSNWNGAAACHIYSDSASATAVSSVAGAGAAVATRVMHAHSTYILLARIVMFPRYLMWKFVRPFHFPDLSGVFLSIPSQKIRIFPILPTQVNSQIINTSYQKLPFGSGDYPDELLFHQALN